MKVFKILLLGVLISNILFAQNKFAKLPQLSEQEFVNFLDEMLIIGCINNKEYKRIVSQKDSLPQKEEIESNSLSSDRIFAFLAIQREANTKEKIIKLKKWIAAFEKKGILKPKEAKRMSSFLEAQKVPEINLRTFWLALANWED